MTAPTQFYPQSQPLFAVVRMVDPDGKQIGDRLVCMVTGWKSVDGDPALAVMGRLGSVPQGAKLEVLGYEPSYAEACRVIRPTRGVPPSAKQRSYLTRS